MRRVTGGLLLAALYCSTAGAFTPEVSTIDAVPLHMVRAPLAKRIEEAETKSRPYQFAVKAALPLGFGDGVWDQLDANTARWRVRITSPGAETLNFEFSKFHLPAGAELWTYDSDGRLAQGPYTQANETPEGKLWTAVVLGDQAVLELRVPWREREQAQIELAEVGHGFRGFGAKDSIAHASAACNVDAVCPEGDPWRNEIRSVARVTIDGQGLCSGQAVNNIRQDDDLLFITANHCGIGQSGEPPSSLVFYWNYENPTCRPHSGSQRREGDGDPSQFTTGASLLSGDRDSDFTLLRLAQTPPAEYDVFLSGWSAANAVPQSGVSIHHPSADVKALALYDSPAVRKDNVCIEGDFPNCTRSIDGWNVNWAEGTTEFGSSGGGLWDQNHHLVGWLSGGPTETCENGPDSYGRMEVAWTAASQPNGQLKAWLDPDNTGATSVDGRDLGATGNRSPIAVNDTLSVAQGSAETLVAVLANDSDADNDPLSISSVTQGNHGGTVTIRGSQIGYRPASTFSGTETFTYTVADGHGGSAVATVTATVIAPQAGGGGGGALSPWLLLLPALLRRRRAAG